MNKKIIKQGIFVFIFIFMIIFILTMLTGVFGKRPYPEITGPIPFKETIQYIPEITIFSVLFTLYALYQNKYNKSR